MRLTYDRVEILIDGVSLGIVDAGEPSPTAAGIEVVVAGVRLGEDARADFDPIDVSEAWERFGAGSELRSGTLAFGLQRGGVKRLRRALRRESLAQIEPWRPRRWRRFLLPASGARGRWRPMRAR